MGGWLDGRVDGQTDGWLMDGRVDGQVDGQVDGRAVAGRSGRQTPGSAVWGPAPPPRLSLGLC